jgi:hypothetical protein
VPEAAALPVPDAAALLVPDAAALEAAGLEAAALDAAEVAEAAADVAAEVADAAADVAAVVFDPDLLLLLQALTTNARPAKAAKPTLWDLSIWTSPPLSVRRDGVTGDDARRRCRQQGGCGRAHCELDHVCTMHPALIGVNPGTG